MTTQTLGTADVVVIGGGIAGCATAYHLARRGTDVMLLERGQLNREASGTNAGSLHLQLYLHPNFPEGWLEQTSPSGPLLREAAAGWATIETDLAADCGVRLGGGLWVAASDSDMALLQAKVAAENAVGIESELLSRSDLADIAPYLGPSVVGGSILRGEGFADPLATTVALARNAERAGARLVTRVTVLDIERVRSGFIVGTDRGPVRAERVVSTAGAWTPLIAAMLGLHIPVHADVVQVNVTEPRPALMRDQLVQHVSRGLSLKQTPRGAFIIGGGWPGLYDRSTKRKVVTLDSFQGNAWAAATTVPEVGEARIVRTWAGMGAYNDDGLPVIGESSRVKGFHAVFSTLGFTLGPIAGQLLAEQMAHGAARVSLAPFTPDRF